MILVDSCVWIDYFKGKKTAFPLNTLIDKRLIHTNEIILTELLPKLRHQKETNLISLIRTIPNCTLSINWDEIKDVQYNNIKSGYNTIGIPDIIIAQNCIKNNLTLLSFDKHFKQLKTNLKKLKLIDKL